MTNHYSLGFICTTNKEDKELEKHNVDAGFEFGPCIYTAFYFLQVCPGQEITRNFSIDFNCKGFYLQVE